MCLTIPARVIKINGQQITIKQGKKTYDVRNFLIPKIKIGDWVLTNANLALNKITSRQAKSLLKLLK